MKRLRTTSTKLTNITIMNDELFTGTIDEIITRLKNKSISIPSWGKLEKDYDPTKHRIVHDQINRRDKIRKNGIVEKAARIHIGLEKLLTSRTNEFMFSIPVKRIYSNIEVNETRQAIAKAIEAIYKHARINAENKRRGIAYFASCEIFTLWYTVKAKNTLYGFNSEYKLKCKTFSPMGDVNLYPLFDEYDDMIAMSWEYSKTIKNQVVTYFETFTEDKHCRWKQNGGSWEEEMSEDVVVIEKIPGAYHSRPYPIWHGLSHIREDIEYTLSRNSDVIAYNSAPILQVAGALKGIENKGESQRVYRVENGGNVSYVSWQQAIEALRYQVSTLKDLFWSQGQMPDISFEQMKSLGNIGYDARQTLFMDAHLKIGDESGSWIEFFERECNVIKAFLKQMKQEWASEIDNVDIEHVITPYIQNDESTEIDKWTKANGGKPLVSHLESIQNAGLSADPNQTLEQIQKEEEEASASQMSSIMGAYQ